MIRIRWSAFAALGLALVCLVTLCPFAAHAAPMPIRVGVKCKYPPY